MPTRQVKKLAPGDGIFEVRKLAQGDGFAVVNLATGETNGRVHEARETADRQRSALYELLGPDAIHRGRELAAVQGDERAMTKFCPGCEKIRSESKFVADARTTDGLSTRCETCRASSSLSQETALDRVDLVALQSLGALETVDVDGIEILSAGGPYFGTGSPPEGDTFDESFLAEIVAANRELASQMHVPIKIGHSKAQKLLANSGLAVDEQPAAGWLENFRLVSGKIVADARAVPRKIADLMEAKAFRTRSVEMSRITEQTPDGPGRTFDTVISALSLLGAKAPAVRTLDDILAWYGERGRAIELLLADEEEPDVERTLDLAVGDVVWDPETGAMDLMSDLAEALNGPMPADPEYWSPRRYWVMDISATADGGLALVNDQAADAECAWVVPWTLGDDGEPVPSDSSQWTLASQKWVQIADDSAAELAETRAATTRSNSPTGADTLRMGAENTATPTLTEERVVALAAAFGIEETDDDARRTAVLAELQTFAAETPPTPTPTPTPPTPPPSPVEGDQAHRELARRAELGERAYEERRIERRDANINVALSQGRIDPKDVPHWARFFDENEELALNALVAIRPDPQRVTVYGSDQQGNGFEELALGMDRAYGAFANGLGIAPYSLQGGQS